MRPEDTLTPREFQVVQAIASGLTYAGVGRELGISPETAKSHLYTARQKVGVDNTVALAVWFVRRYPTQKDEEAGYVSACCNTVNAIGARIKTRMLARRRNGR